MSNICKTMIPEYSVGGFLEVSDGGRNVCSLNIGWRFWKGAAAGAQTAEFDDGAWPLVNVPHGLEVLPLEASGGINYQGEAWYRKRFQADAALQGRRVVLHFEGVMGKTKFWVNGRLVQEHFGGYLPCTLDVTDVLAYGGENLIAVCADNSDDPTYPPGRPQAALDFAYFGGLYRDVWLIATDKIHITDPNEVDVIAGGGVFVHCEEVSRRQATVHVATHVANGGIVEQQLDIELQLLDRRGSVAASCRSALGLAAAASGTNRQTLQLENAHLWRVDDPYLHDLIVRVKDRDGSTLDAVRLRLGIREIEFKGRDGFFLNGEPFDGKLIGANRHQDYAFVGNAVSNGAHWRDAVLLRQAGMRMIRCAHYPQDPAFMDACDALGMFVIVTTPGWQFWNGEPVFEQRVLSDIRNMVRRDRNRPSVWLWEPILNETEYPAGFARKAHETTHEEYPCPGCYTACDVRAAGQECYDVVYAPVHGVHDGDMYAKTPENAAEYRFDYAAESRCVFTREWGDCPADWQAQSSPSRVHKGWGEHAQLLQARHYADPDYYCGCSYETLCAAPPQHVGGALWHGTDHQRGYNSYAFWGGMLDALRQPKYSYHMFRSQLPPKLNIPLVNSEPFVYIAHLMHPTSDADVTVFSNCEEVRLRYNGAVVGCQPTRPEGIHMPRHPVVFEKTFRFFRHFRHDMEAQTFEAEGLIDGKVVARATRRTWGNTSKIVLEADLCGIALQADGGDFVPVVARIVDKHGEIVRLTEETIRFSVEGPGEVIGGDVAGINPQPLCWGEAVVLVRAGLEPSDITVRAESARLGVHKPAAAEIMLKTTAPVSCVLGTPALASAFGGKWHQEENGLRRSNNDTQGEGCMRWRRRIDLGQADL